MADKKEVFLTAKGFTEIEEELDELKRVKRPEIIIARCPDIIITDFSRVNISTLSSPPKLDISITSQTEGIVIIIPYLIYCCISRV